MSVDFLQLLLFRMVWMLQPRFLSVLLSVQLIFLTWVSKVFSSNNSLQEGVRNVLYP